jgi:hypothetical protein
MHTCTKYFKRTLLDNKVEEEEKILNSMEQSLFEQFLVGSASSETGSV